MQVKKKILEFLNKEGLAYSGLNNLFSFISKTYNFPISEVKREFEKLEKEGLVFEIRKGKFITIPSCGYARGKFIGNAKGFGFVQAQNMNDIFIPANMTMNALDGDEVIVKVLSNDGEDADGKIEKIYKPIDKIVGVVVKVGKSLFLEPDNNHIAFKIKLIAGQGFWVDDRVVAKVLRDGKNPRAKVVENLGKISDVKSCELGIIRQFNLYETFPENVNEECKKIPDHVLPGQKKGRIDFTKDVVFTIDGEDAKDFDDAVSIKKNEKGNFLLSVHIADVGQYVKYDSSLDQEAYNRGTSVYFPTSVLPMLPIKLSNGICSLNEGVERLTLSCIMEVDKNGTVISHQICEGVIKSCARLTYTEVYAALQGKTTTAKASKLKKHFLMMLELSKILQEKRKREGSLDFEIPEVEFVFDQNGMAIDLKNRERNDAHRLIEDFMVLANETVAKEFFDKKIPFVYRVHENPKKEKVLSVIDFFKGLGVKVPQIPEEISPKFYQQLLALVENETYQKTANTIILRSMQKAKYSNECLGHFGLGLKFYCHFTSPIRRYPDLTIHRIIKETLHKKNLTKSRLEELDDFAISSSEQSSLTERNAEKCEREVDDLWKAYLMKDRIGEEFEGIISSVTNFGVFVELDNTVEGLIKIEDLPPDQYLFFERQLKLKGQTHSFSIGQKLKVKLANANIYTRKIDFVLA